MKPMPFLQDILKTGGKLEPQKISVAADKSFVFSMLHWLAYWAVGMLTDNIIILSY